MTIEQLKEWRLDLEQAHTVLDDPENGDLEVADLDEVHAVIRKIEHAIADLYREEARGK